MDYVTLESQIKHYHSFKPVVSDKGFLKLSDAKQAEGRRILDHAVQAYNKHKISVLELHMLMALLIP